MTSFIYGPPLEHPTKVFLFRDLSDLINTDFVTVANFSIDAVIFRKVLLLCTFEFYSENGHSLPNFF